MARRTGHVTPRPLAPSPALAPEGRPDLRGRSSAAHPAGRPVVVRDIPAEMTSRRRGRYQGEEIGRRGTGTGPASWPPGASLGRPPRGQGELGDLPLAQRDRQVVGAVVEELRALAVPQPLVSGLPWRPGAAR